MRGIINILGVTPLRPAIAACPRPPAGASHRCCANNRIGNHVFTRPRSKPVQPIELCPSRVVLGLDGSEETDGATIACKIRTWVSLPYEHFCASASPRRPPSGPPLRTPKGAKGPRKIFQRKSHVTH